MDLTHLHPYQQVHSPQCANLKNQLEIRKNELKSTKITMIKLEHAHTRPTHESGAKLSDPDN